MPDVPEQSQTIPMTDITSSFGSIPLYYPESPLVSDWPKNLMKVRYRFVQLFFTNFFMIV